MQFRHALPNPVFAEAKERMALSAYTSATSD
jgi:hypothetical protein